MPESVCSNCRREGIKLYLKGEKCFTSKCPLVRRKSPPGIHGSKGYPRQTEYGDQLREKQRMKRYYGLREAQFERYFREAEKKVGNKEIEFVRALEMRLDSIVYRAGFAVSRAMCRQLIGHGHMTVNQKKMDIPSYQVRVGDEISFALASSARERARESLNAKGNQAKMPKWLALDKEKLSIKVLQLPSNEDISTQFTIKKIIEFYSR